MSTLYIYIYNVCIHIIIYTPGQDSPMVWAQGILAAPSEPQQTPPSKHKETATIT